MEMTNYIEERINTLKGSNKIFQNMQEYHLFTILCMKYFFFNEDKQFDQDDIAMYLTDGGNDGGIDAVFNDPNSEFNDVIVVQSKFYENTKLYNNDIVGELYKISETIKNIDACKISGINENVVTAYRNAMSQKEDSGIVRIVFFTSYNPKNKRERNKLEKINTDILKNYELEMNFRSDIEEQIESIDNGKLCVDNDKIEIDEKDNFLRYKDSVIVNISARSLQDLQNRRRNGLLGRNLRYYVRQKMVDAGIEDTVKNNPDFFWYKNNGIIIICDDYKIDGKILKLKNFSIVNGGQTTHRIGKLDIGNDFFLQCKVIKVQGNDMNDRDRFVHSIAEASNAQKPIRKADLKANTPEQLRLKERLARYGVYYMTKKGDKVPKQYSEPYQSAKLDQVGKIELAAVLQMPGSARSNSQRMYQDEYYYPIFGPEAKENVIADLLKIEYYYGKFLKNNFKNKGYDEKTTLPMMRNGRTFQLACITFLCKINYSVFQYNDIASKFDNIDELKSILKKMDGMEKIISNKVDNEQEIFDTIFEIIGDEVLGYCFGNALYEASEKQSTLAPSNYLKLDINYYKHILKRLWSRYNGNKGFKLAIDTICGKSI